MKRQDIGMPRKGHNYGIHPYFRVCFSAGLFKAVPLSIILPLCSYVDYPKVPFYAVVCYLSLFPSVPWFEIVLLWFFGIVLPWFFEIVLPWFFGIVLPWFFEIVLPWFFGIVLPWFFEIVLPWFFGIVLPWFFLLESISLHCDWY